MNININHTRGSVLLAMLFHASINATVETFPAAFLPSLFSPDVTVHIGVPLWTELLVLALGIGIILATHGRLGYDQYKRDMASSARGISLPK